MAITINRVRVRWTGFTGAPGVSTFYCSTPATAVPALSAFYNTVKSTLPGVCSVQVASDGDVLDDSTGAITGSWSTAPQSAVAGTGGTNYSGPSGGCVDWLTSTVIKRRRVMGRTFLVPMATTMYDTDGTLTSTCLSTVSGAASTLLGAVGAGGLFVWHRPKALALGQAVPITGLRVPDKGVVLRSRRD